MDRAYLAPGVGESAQQLAGGTGAHGGVELNRVGLRRAEVSQQMSKNHEQECHETLCHPCLRPPTLHSLPTSGGKFACLHLAIQNYTKSIVKNRQHAFSPQRRLLRTSVNPPTKTPARSLFKRRATPEATKTKHSMKALHTASVFAATLATLAALAAATDPLVAAATNAGSGQPWTTSGAGVDVSALKAGGLECTNATTVWTWPGEAFQPNQAKTYIAGAGCPNGAPPTGCGCGNGDFNVPVLAQELITTRVVPGNGSCMCTYYLPAGFPPSAGFTIRVQNVCPQ